ncbi:MAG: MFS transporter [Chloroflexota bacterium]
MTTQTPPSDHIDANGWWVLVVTVVASSIAYIMQAALNVALPVIQIELDASGADILWIINAYLLFLSSFLLVGGAWGDLFGRRRVFVMGILIFTGASIVCGLASNTTTLIVARAIQGFGGALMVPGSLAIIAAYFDDATRGRAVSIWATFTTGATLFASVLGGVLADLGIWRAIFWVTIPLSLFSLYGLLTRVPESYDKKASKHIDWLGTALITLSLGLIVYGATELGRTPTFDNPRLFWIMLLGALLMGVFVWVEQRVPQPILPLKLFRSPTFTGINILTFCLYGALTTVLTFIPLLLQQVQNYSATAAGLVDMPITILVAVLSGWAGTLNSKYGPRRPMIVGSTIAGIGFALLAIPSITTGPVTYWITYFPGFFMLGIAFGIINAPLTNAALSSVPQRYSGLASGINHAMARAAGVLLLAFMGGISIISFGNTLQTSLVDIPISAENTAQLIENASDFANIAIPDTIAPELYPQTERAVNHALLNVFRVLMLIAAALCWIGTLVSHLIIEDTLDPHNELDTD